MSIIGRGTARPRTAPPTHYEIEDLAPLDLVRRLARTYPGLAVEPGLLRLAVHVLRAPDQDGGIVPLPVAFLAEICGRGRACRNKRAVTGPVLRELEAALRAVASGGDAATLLRSPPNRRLHYATGVKLSFPSPIAEAARLSRDVPADDRITIDGWCRVRLDGTWTGLKDTSVIRTEMIASLPDPSTAPGLSRALQDYLNAHDPRVYQGLRKHIQEPKTGRFVREHFPDDTSRYGVVAALRDVLRQPVPIYSTSERTARISAVGRNATSLPSPLRHHLTEELGWMELDLAHAQLACNAAAWEVPEVLERLSKPGYRFWDDLLDHVGVDAGRLRENDRALYDLVKKAVKTPVHGLSFGMNQRNVKRMGLLTFDRKLKRWYRKNDWDAVERTLERAAGVTVEAAGERLATHPLVAAMLRAREVQAEAVAADGGRADCFGVFHELVPEVRDGPNRRGGVEPRHVLARVTQARELDLLQGVIADAVAEVRKTRLGGGPGRANYRIVLWQHDGFTVSAKGGSEARLKQVGRKLRRIVSERAQELGVPTQLGVDVGPDLDG